MANRHEVDDRFKRFGIIGFTETTKINDFIDHLDNGAVTGTRCKACGRVFFPPRADCCQCLSSDMEWFEVSGTGTLVSFSTLQYAPSGFDADVPYSIAVVDFGNYKVFGRISEDISDDALKVGLPMKVAVKRLADDRLSYVFQQA